MAYVRYVVMTTYKKPGVYLMFDNDAQQIRAEYNTSSEAIAEVKLANRRDEFRHMSR